MRRRRFCGCAPYALFCGHPAAGFGRRQPAFPSPAPHSTDDPIFDHGDHITTFRWECNIKGHMYSAGCPSPLRRDRRIPQLADILFSSVIGNASVTAGMGRQGGHSAARRRAVPERRATECAPYPPSLRTCEIIGRKPQNQKCARW